MSICSCCQFGRCCKQTTASSYTVFLYARTDEWYRLKRKQVAFEVPMETPTELSTRTIRRLNPAEKDGDSQKRVFSKANSSALAPHGLRLAAFKVW